MIRFISSYIFSVRNLSILILVFIFSCSDKKSKEEKEAVRTEDSLVPNAQRNVDPIPVKRFRPLPLPDSSAFKLVEKLIRHPNGDSFHIMIAKGFDIKPVAWGMKRIRFMANSPDGKLFITDMHDLSDNSKGKIYILSEWDDSTKTFESRKTYLQNLRNPNSIAFYKEGSDKYWLYIAMTDKLVRYVYNPGDELPSSSPEVLATFPDYGLSYRYGGWHLTRTVQFGDNGKLYVSVGSSCNTCIEKEEVRASVLEMDPDGKNARVFAKGLRNAVGLEWAEGSLYATNMAADHLGNDKPDDVMFRVDENQNYGWPYCYNSNGNVYADPLYDTSKSKIEPTLVPKPFSSFGAHTAPLGLSWFGEDKASDNALKNYFLVAQHGAYTPIPGRGYSIQRVRENHAPENFITGFGDKAFKGHGRPCGILPIGNNRFYFTDDKFGTLYLVYKE